MGNRVSAVNLKACRLFPGRVRESTPLESFRSVLRSHEPTSRSVFKCRLSRSARYLVHRRRCEVIVIQAAV
jgi:hypothetical protein